MCRAMWSASSSTRNASPITTSSIASPKSSGKRDMWTPFCAGSRSTVHSMSADTSFSAPAYESRIALLTPVTPTRERPICTSGGEAWRSSVRRFQGSMSAGQDTSFARLVSLACHDLRTPLATVHGFATTIARTAQLEEPAARYVEMIETASRQLADLLDELGLAARIEAGRYEPTKTEVALGELVRTAAARLDEDIGRVPGEGDPVRVDAPAAERALAALVRCALRHGGLEHVDVRVEGRRVEVSPITPASAPVVLGEDLRDLGAAVAVRLVRTLGGSVAVEAETLRITLPGA